MTKRCAHNDSKKNVRRCDVCDAHRRLDQLFAGDNRYEPLRTTLVAKIEARFYGPLDFYHRKSILRIGITALLARVEPPDHSWVDGLPSGRISREKFRAELVASGVLDARDDEAGTYALGMLQKISSAPCIHSKGICERCRAERFITARLSSFPHLASLSEYYLTELREHRLIASYFRSSKARWLPTVQIGERSDRLTHEWLDGLKKFPAVRDLRRDLVACGLLPDRIEYVKCLHADRGMSRRRGCEYCAAKRSLRRLIGKRPYAKALLVSFDELIDSGTYNEETFYSSSMMTRVLRLLPETDGGIDEAWLRSLPVRDADRLRIRLVLEASGLFSSSAPASNFETRHIPAASVTKKPCEHRATVCARCSAVRSIEAAFASYPSFFCLRDRYVEQIRSGFYEPYFFRRTNNPLWKWIRVLGDGTTLVDLAWLELQPQSRGLRSFRTELERCGLIPTTRDHIQVGRFATWAETFLSSLPKLHPADQVTLERYRRLSLMSYARKHLNRRKDRGPVIVGILRMRLRRAATLAITLRTKKKDLASFTYRDLGDIPKHQHRDLRPFVLWLKQNGFTTTDWDPKDDRQRQGYRGLYESERRKIIASLKSDESLPLALRVAGLLSCIGLTYVQLASMRASDVLYCGRLVVGKNTLPLGLKIWKLLIRLRNELVDVVRDTRPNGWDPWLFAPANAIELPSHLTLSKALSRIGVPSQLMRNDTIRMGSLEPTSHFVMQRAFGRTKVTVGRHYAAFNAEGASIVSQRVVYDDA